MFFFLFSILFFAVGVLVVLVFSFLKKIIFYPTLILVAIYCLFVFGWIELNPKNGYKIDRMIERVSTLFKDWNSENSVEQTQALEKDVLDVGKDLETKDSFVSQAEKTAKESMQTAKEIIDGTAATIDSTVKTGEDLLEKGEEFYTNSAVETEGVVKKTKSWIADKAALLARGSEFFEIPKTWYDDSISFFKNTFNIRGESPPLQQDTPVERGGESASSIDGNTSSENGAMTNVGEEIIDGETTKQIQKERKEPLREKATDGFYEQAITN